MHEDSKSDDFLESVKQSVRLDGCKRVLRSSYFDQNMPFAAIVTEIMDPHLKELYDGNSFLLEAWNRGRLIFQRGFKKNLHVFNSARQDNTIIYVPDPVDEPEQGRRFIYLVSLGEWLNDVNERKIEDWTGLCSNE